MKRLIYFVYFLFIIFISSSITFSQNTIVVSGAGIVAANGTYTEAGTSNSKPYYTKGIYRVEYRNGGFGIEWEIWDTVEPNIPLRVKYFNINAGNTPVVTGWQVDAGTGPAPSVTNLVFSTGGSSYTPPASIPGTNSNPIGRFNLDPGADGSNLSSLTVNFSGSSAGITAVKLWNSADASFSTGSDVQVNGQSYNSTITFSSFSSAIARVGSYYFITVDLTAGASGTIQGTIPNQASLTMTSGTMQNTFSNQTLSASSSTLPVELVSFTAEINKNLVQLHWKTSSEVNNNGFEIERRVSPSGTNEWSKIGFVSGSGNSSSEKEYSFIDKNPMQGNVDYRLKQMDNDGTYEYSDEVSVNSIIPGDFTLSQNYPNPFNPTTNIKFSLPESGFVTLAIYNILGEEVARLADNFMDAGIYNFEFNADKLSSGVYLYMLNVNGKFKFEKKMNYLK